MGHEHEHARSKHGEQEPHHGGSSPSDRQWKAQQAAGSAAVSRAAFGDDEGSTVVGETDKSRLARETLRRMNDRLRSSLREGLQAALPSRAESANEASNDAALKMGADLAVRAAESTFKNTGVALLGEAAVATLESVAMPFMTTWEIGSILTETAKADFAAKRARSVDEKQSLFLRRIDEWHAATEARIDKMDPEEALKQAKMLPPQISSGQVRTYFEKAFRASALTDGSMPTREAIDRIAKAKETGVLE